MCKNFRWVFTLAVLCSLVLAAVSPAAEKAKSYRWTVEQAMQVAGQDLVPGRYVVQVSPTENGKAMVVVVQKDRTLVRVEAAIEALPEASGEDGVRVVLPDGRTRVVQKLWFQGAKYLLNLQPTDQMAGTEVKPQR